MPNDGYGAGYGQTDSLDGDVQNLKNLQSMLKPMVLKWGCGLNLISIQRILKSLKRRTDIAKEVSVAGVKALKTTWRGSGMGIPLA